MSGVFIIIFLLSVLNGLCLSFVEHFTFSFEHRLNGFTYVTRRQFCFRVKKIVNQHIIVIYVSIQCILVSVGVYNAHEHCRRILSRGQVAAGVCVSIIFFVVVYQCVQFDFIYSLIRYILAFEEEQHKYNKELIVHSSHQVSLDLANLCMYLLLSIYRAFFSCCCCVGIKVCAFNVAFK